MGKHFPITEIEKKEIREMLIRNGYVKELSLKKVLQTGQRVFSAPGYGKMYLTDSGRDYLNRMMSAYKTKLLKKRLKNILGLFKGFTSCIITGIFV